MQEVNIYIDFSKRTPAAIPRKYAYVLECKLHGETYTKEAFGVCEGSLHYCTLSVLIMALERIRQRCHIYIHAPDPYILNMLISQLPAWNNNSFRDSRGKELANVKEWRRLWQLLEQQEYCIRIGAHSYTDWMQRQFESEGKQ